MITAAYNVYYTKTYKNNIVNNGIAVVFQLDPISLNNSMNIIIVNKRPIYDYCHTAM